MLGSLWKEKHFC